MLPIARSERVSELGQYSYKSTVAYFSFFVVDALGVYLLNILWAKTGRSDQLVA